MKLNPKNVKLSIVAIVVLALGGLQAQGQSLSKAEKVDLQKQLDELLDSAESSSKQRFSTALSAFGSAIQSDVKAHEMYLECYEKVNFIDKQRSSQEFRDWKRKHKERHDLPQFRKALRHQLNWLLLCIKVSANPDEMHEFSGQAVQKIDTIMSELDTLKSQQNVLKQKVLGSVFAKAYNINGLEADGWPMSPTDVSGVYDKIVLPHLRESGSITTVRAGWDKRIRHEGLIKKEWSDVPQSNRISAKKATGTPEYETWLKNGYLTLLWEKEVDCFSFGDQVNASNNMLAHLRKHINHKLSLEWVKEFQGIAGIGETNGFEIPEKASTTTEE